MSKSENKKQDHESDDELEGPVRLGAGMRLRNYFLTGLVIAAPISITIYLTWSFIHLVDEWIKPLVPAQYNPDTYLPFSVPGVGLIIAISAITLLGFFAANLFGRTVVQYGETLVHRMPLVRTIYKTLKQIFETVLAQNEATFKQVALVEYPRRGIHAIAFVATNTKGEIANRLGNGDEHISVFLPTTPNPTSGFLLFVPRKDVIFLDMSVEDAAKLVISAGLVTPDHTKAKALRKTGDAPEIEGAEPKPEADPEREPESEREPEKVPAQ